MNFAVGTLVKARGREWVVLPESQEDLLMLRPLGGTEDEVTGIYVPLEKVESAHFDLPDPNQLGDYRSGRLLRDAIRIGFRSSAGPFRSFGKIAVQPRPYQLVPLLMALKLDPVRVLIADDVGIGKTVEACLIARELLDRGEITRMAVLCPPHLAEQWQTELKNKFHIDAELVLPSTVTRLERNCGIGESLFELYPFVIVSTDFVKSDRRRDEFLRTCPEFVIVDEAHTCAFGENVRGGKHQRYQLLSGLAENSARHLVLVTATPHSGNENAFRSLLSLLNSDFENFPESIVGKENVGFRRKLSKYLVQRRRADIRHFMKEETPFPIREEAEETYKLSPEYKKLFNRVLRYARETVMDENGSGHHQRVKWWSALALLRSLASSPAAAVATLRSRASTIQSNSIEEANDIGKRTVLDIDTDDLITDVIPGSDIASITNDEKKNRRVLLQMAREAELLYGKKDHKLTEVTKLIKRLISEGYNPIIFCRFIPTAEYLAEQLRKKLPKKVNVTAVTGNLPPTEREERVINLIHSEQRVLVATDCLSEGINLQEGFDSVIHYDLSWNPTRHEQREGRVDRYGQTKGNVRVVTYYGVDNQIDGIVLDVLLRKHKTIKSSLGISVPIPVDANSVVEAIFEGLLLKGKNFERDFEQLSFDFDLPIKEEVFRKWDDVTAKEKRSRTMFAQDTIKVDEVSRELESIKNVIGTEEEIKDFVQDGLQLNNAVVSGEDVIRVNLKDSPSTLKESLGNIEQFNGKFAYPVPENTIYLSRTHPIVEGLANFIINNTLDAKSKELFRRSGAIRTNYVSKRTTVILTRLRYHIIEKIRGKESVLLAEESQLYSFQGSPKNAEWLTENDSEKLLMAEPSSNIDPNQAIGFMRQIIDNFDYIKPTLEQFAQNRGAKLLDEHSRVRTASKQKGNVRVEPKLPLDILGIYMYLPEPKV
ncbi:helicase-related protein [Gracilibacillus massiliensis]|uniref:helicase-related protein n=1 Tax=Gracilibacillus massiliensis TaxID=1564956 RepID=UPI00071D9BB4|nr:helicase-related protein [Gracilibacillus massiliensis]